MADFIGPTHVPPLHQRLDADDFIEFHAARLLLLLEICGGGQTRARRIDGRTKLAKLDFFLRYPKFLERAHDELRRRDVGQVLTPYAAQGEDVEAPMIRYRFGPWDPDYRDYLAFLEARGLLRVVGTKIEGFSLTSLGRQTAKALQENPAYSGLVSRAESIRDNLATWVGSELKNFIYQLFAVEVGAQKMRREIR